MFECDFYAAKQYPLITATYNILLLQLISQQFEEAATLSTGKFLSHSLHTYSTNKFIHMFII